MPANCVYRPPENKVQAAQRINYLGKSRIIASIDEKDTIIGFKAPQLRKALDKATNADNNAEGEATKQMMAARKEQRTMAGLRFDTTANAWQVSSSVNSDGSPIDAYANLTTGGGAAFVAGSNTQVQFNDGGTFGATANLTFNKVTNVLTVQGSQALGNIGTAPSAVSNAVVIYNNAPGAGDTGLYAITSTTNDELVAYNKAKLLSIIF